MNFHHLVWVEIEVGHDMPLGDDFDMPSCGWEIVIPCVEVVGLSEYGVDRTVIDLAEKACGLGLMCGRLFIACVLSCMVLLCY